MQYLVAYSCYRQCHTAAVVVLQNTKHTEMSGTSKYIATLKAIVSYTLENYVYIFIKYSDIFSDNFSANCFSAIYISFIRCQVHWPGVLSEALGYRQQAARWLASRHISLARADKLIAKACIAILEGELGLT